MENDRKRDVAPLAVRMRPRTLDEVVGQTEAVGEGSWLRAAIENDTLSSVILFGPAGTGKTSLAHVIAESTRATFVEVSAIGGTVSDLRREIDAAEKRLVMGGLRTILFVDEIHRFNRSQQDALLHAVEDRLVVLVGATTENPFFEVNSALISRSRIVELHSLSDDEIAEEAKPAVGRVDPLVERLSLTVDAANLELMRVDQILEDVTQITDSVSKAAGAVDTVTSAPIDLVNSLTGKLRSKFKPRYASDESVSLGAAADASAAAKAGRAPERGATVADAVSAMGDAARAVVAEGKDRRAAVKAANAASQERAHDFEDQLSGTAGTIADAAVANANADIDTDAPAATAPADPAAAAPPAISPNAAAAQAKPASAGNSPYTVQ